MKKTKPVFDFAQYVMAEKISFFRHVNQQLYGNPLFPTPDIPAAEATAMVDALEAAMQAAKEGGPAAMSALHDAAERADTLYRNLAHYVERIAAGDETSILSSGFHISKQPVIKPKPELVALDGEHSGDAKLMAKPKDRGTAFKWQMCKVSDDGTDEVWVDIDTTTRATIVVKGLEIMKRYKFRYAVVTPDGTSDYCEPVSKIIT
jgi:hypothetical protein